LTVLSPFATLLLVPRQLRIEFEGAVYHVLNRGDRREVIFHDADDRERFLVALGEACAKTDWQVHAYCLMPNHFHLVLETPHANLVAGMKWLLGTYTNRFNHRHKLSGHLFAGRYKSLIVDGSQSGYLRTVCEYVHLNPVRAGLIGENAALREYPWSSFKHYLQPQLERPPWLRIDRLFGEMRIPRDTVAGRREFERVVEMRRRAQSNEEWNALRRGWCFGEEGFRRQLLDQVRQGPDLNHYAPPRRESNEAKAERVVAEELTRVGWNESDLDRRRRGDPEKVRIARRLRAETTVGLKWIADRLRMGAWTTVSNHLASPPAVDSRQTTVPTGTGRQGGSVPAEGGVEPGAKRMKIVRTDPSGLPLHCL
jgi:REP-associated tyrosine transposase